MGHPCVRHDGFVDLLPKVSKLYVQRRPTGSNIGGQCLQFLLTSQHPRERVLKLL